ncbi:MAG: hypothetical protein J6I80_02025 [Clostridia bacterium]|nr:hypothetical protein [Clostridia bacterium]
MSSHFFDSDVKIAGAKPSETVKQNLQKGAKQEELLSPELCSKAAELGKIIATEYCNAGEQFLDATGDSADAELLLQRQLLLSFTVTVGFERFCSQAVAGYAQKSFLDELSKISHTLYQNSTDTGAFSFYYLAYRHYNEVERRMGQTFAMLCSHDGDPIYQELGEALYCWFSSLIEEKCKALGLAQ